jgi:hypothetical protein
LLLLWTKDGSIFTGMDGPETQEQGATCPAVGATTPSPPTLTDGVADIWRFVEAAHTYFALGARKLIRTAEAALWFAGVGVAWSAGGDMTLVVPCLVFSWVVGLIGIGGISFRRPENRAVIITVFSFLMIGIWFFLFIHFQKAPAEPQSSVSPPPVSPPMVEYRKEASLADLSNKQLLNATVQFGVKLREFEAHSDIWEMPQYSQSDSQEQRSQKWNQMIQRQEARSREKELSFGNNYFMTARDLRQEILSRLKKAGILPPYFPEGASPR